MTSEALPVFRINANHDVETGVPLLLAGRMPPGREKIIWQAYRRRGICGFFLEGLPRLLHADLQRSGAAFLHHLKLLSDDVKATGGADPFFDSIACRDFGTAEEIARHSRRTWNADEEYEDDFLYVHFLMSLFFVGALDDDLRAILHEFERVLEGQPSPRLDVCWSFLERDPTRLDMALDTLVRDRERFFRQGAFDESILPEEWATDGMLFIEGLALLVLADRLDLPTRSEYVLMPWLARVQTQIAYDRDAWRSPGT